MSQNGTMERKTQSWQDAERIAVENAAGARASADPTPGPVAKAFPLPDVQVGPFSVRAPRAYDWALMKKLDSPIHRLVQEMSNDLEKGNGMDISDEESWLICWQFTRPCREVDAVYCKGGKELVLQTAKEVFGFEYDGTQISTIVKTVIKQIADTWQTALSFSQEKEGGDGATTFFPQSQA